MSEGTVSPVGESWRLGYRPELDGLRALAVTAVMLSHGQFWSFPFAGVVGVNTFFVLSGFLITTLLLEEHADSGRVALGAFWRRRFVRLLPALFLMVAVVATVPLGIDRPQAVDVAGIAGYAANWVMTFVQVYEPLVHTWSLAVEEQFYVVWPLVVVAVLRWGRARWIIPLALAAAIPSVALRVALWDPELRWLNRRVYFGTDTNAAPLLIGCALAAAFGVYGQIRVSRWFAVAAGAGMVTLTGVVGASFPNGTIDRITREVRFGIVWAPVLTAVLAAPVIAYLVTDGAPWLRRPWLVQVGRLSYGIYLWHFPIFKVAEPMLGTPMRGIVGETIAPVAVTFLFAWASYRWVEQPIIRRWRTRSTLSATAPVNQAHPLHESAARAKAT